MEQNEFTKDAVYYIKRAAPLLSLGMTTEQLHDAILFFAFGIERTFKSILVDINPAFILESDSFDNCLRVIYKDKLTEVTRDKIERDSSKQANHNLLVFKASMLRAAKFSKTVEDNIGTFTKLSDYRGIIAHRPLCELNEEESKRFLIRIFHPTVRTFASDLGFSAGECFGRSEKQLKELSDKITTEDNIRKHVDDLLEKHLKEWEKLKNNAAHITKAQKETATTYTSPSHTGQHAIEYCCPACSNDGILYVDEEWEVEGSTGDGYMVGMSVTGFGCKFCNLQLDDYEQFDYLNMNEFLSGT